MLILGKRLAHGNCCWPIASPPLLKLPSYALDQTAARRTLTLGSCHYTRRDLEEIRDAGQMIHIQVLGLASIAADVSPQLALATIASVEVLGAFRAPTAVKAALAPRTA